MNDKIKHITITRGDCLKIAVETSFDAVVFDGLLLGEKDLQDYTCSVHIFEMKHVKEQDEKTIDVTTLKQNFFDINIPLIDFERPVDTLKVNECRGKVLLVLFRASGCLEPIAECYLLIAPEKLRINKLQFANRRQEDNTKEKKFRSDQGVPLVCSFNRKLLTGEETKTRLRLYYDCTTFTSNSGKRYEAFSDMEANYEQDSIWNITFEERYAGAKFAISAFRNSPVNPNSSHDSQTIRYVNLLSSRGKQKIRSVYWSSDERIEFDKYGHIRQTIHKNEDGFLHIHTQGMFGHLVDIILYEEDMFGTEQISICQRKSVVIKDNCCCVSFSMKEVERYARRRRLALLEGGDFEIIAEVVPHEQKIAPARSSVLSLNFIKETKNPAYSRVGGIMKGVSGKMREKEKRSQQKSCGGKYCITKENYKQKNVGKLIQEINIRLAGFGGNVPTEEFTDRTESCIKQFQRDYMKVLQTGKICGSLLKAIDEFCTNPDYNFNFDEIKCPCTSGKYSQLNKENPLCHGFGNGREKEHPGIHRSILYILKGLIFYLKENKSEYSLNCIYSGYRCWTNNKHNKRKSTNHMGCALDLHFNKNGIRTKETEDMEKIRTDFFCKYMGAPSKGTGQSYGFGWIANHVGLEPKKFNNGISGATSWVHVDIREFNDIYKTTEFFIDKESALVPENMLHIAKKMGLTDLCQCILYKSPKAYSKETEREGRVDPQKLKTSAKGIEFIKSWESLKLRAYDDSQGFGTIGYGHLIARESITIYLPDEYKNGITKEKADQLFREDLIKYERAIERDIKSPLYQNEYDALVSLLFNCGENFFKNNKAPKLYNHLKNKDYSKAADEFADITRGGKGLKQRRQDEINIFKNNVYNNHK